MEDMEHTGTGHDKCGRILLWDRPGAGRRDMVVRRKKASVSGRSTGNGYGNDRNPLYNAVVLLPDV